MPRIAATVTAVLIATVLHAGAAPEFGPSIAYGKGEPAFTLGGLRGKVVVVVFFQSWCPKCNGWSSTMLKQTEAAWADDRTVALIALKTDGGDVAAARKYLSEHGADPAKWLVASDLGGAFQTLVNGKEDLWTYAIVDPDGNLAQVDHAGTYYPTLNVFALGRKETIAPYAAEARTVLPKDKSYPPALAGAVRKAESGCLVEALLECQSLGAPGKALREDILAVVTARVAKDAATLAAAAGTDRFRAYRALRIVAQQLSGSEPAKTATAALREADKDKAIQAELTAERAYLGIMERAQSVPVRSRSAALAEAMKKLADAHPGTLFGATAADDAKRYAQGDAPAR